MNNEILQQELEKWNAFDMFREYIKESDKIDFVTQYYEFRQIPFHSDVYDPESIARDNLLFVMLSLWHRGYKKHINEIYKECIDIASQINYDEYYSRIDAEHDHFIAKYVRDKHPIQFN